LSERYFDPRITEQRNPRTTSIDVATPLEMVDLMNAEDALVSKAVGTQREEIALAIGLAEDAFRVSGRLIYVGAGTSGRLGVLDAAECPPTFGTSPSMVIGIIAGGESALTSAVEGAEDREGDGVRAMNDHAVDGRDMVVGIAASGTTPFVRGALTRARARGARTALVSCAVPDQEILAQLDVAIVPVVGPEVVTGSTRLKAGSATKMVLNMISTGSMIRLGKTYGNLMVDLTATNAKLSDRSRRILMELCDISRDRAAELLESADGRVKTALVMQILGVEKPEALRLLADAGGVVRRVLPEHFGSMDAIG
jgi:N-acetylmuramic acid 6-phosphate etherase